MTQDRLAALLGVRRTSVTLAAMHLKLANAIGYRRGMLVVKDAAVLRSFACECVDALAEIDRRQLESSSSPSRPADRAS